MEELTYDKVGFDFFKSVSKALDRHRAGKSVVIKMSATTKHFPNSDLPLFLIESKIPSDWPVFRIYDRVWEVVVDNGIPDREFTVADMLAVKPSGKGF